VPRVGFCRVDFCSPDLNRHAPVPRDKGRVERTVPPLLSVPRLLNLLENLSTRLLIPFSPFKITRRSTGLANRERKRNSFLRGRMIDACRNKTAAGTLRDRFKIPLTKGISSYWYQRRRFGYNSLVTSRSRWTPSIRR